jgi:hypothetical protein
MLTKTWQRFVAGGAVVMMSAFGFFGGCFDHGDNCGPTIAASERQICDIP